MFSIGCHLSSSGGYRKMGETALELGATTFQFFTRNPRGGTAKAVDPADAAAFCALAAEHGFGKLVAHAPYTLNPCAADARVREFAFQTMADDLARLEFVPGNSTIVLLETMAGKGSEVGGRFEELAAIIDGTVLSEKVGVCLDTCHVSDGGYDIVGDLDGVLEEFDRVIGLSRLKAIHLNDSLNPRGAKKDRHARIGEGTIGLEAMARIINHPALADLPFCLETPNELDGYAREIALLKSLRKGE